MKIFNDNDESIFAVNNGIVIKDAQNKQWRLSVNNSGVVQAQVVTPTLSIGNTPTPTPTNTPTVTPTNTPTISQTNTPTRTQTPTISLTQSVTPTPTNPQYSNFSIQGVTTFPPNKNPNGIYYNQGAGPKASYTLINASYFTFTVSWNTGSSQWRVNGPDGLILTSSDNVDYPWFILNWNLIDSNYGGSFTVTQV